MLLQPYSWVRRQARQPPSAVLATMETQLPWYRDKGIRTLLFPMITIYLTQVCTGYDATLTSNLQSFARWKKDMDYPDANHRGLISSIYFMGCLAGSIPAAYVCDRWGRRAGVALGQIFTVAGALFQGLSEGRNQYMGSRLILGFGIGFITCAGPALLSELAPPRFRGPIVSFFNPVWYLGSIIVAWTCFGTSHMDAMDKWNWRIPSFLQGLIPFSVLCVVYFLPESPRWLVAQGRIDEATAVLAKYHGDGNADDIAVTQQVAEIREAIESAHEGVTWRALLTHKTNLQRIFIVTVMVLMTLWCGQNIITYYFSTILSSVGISGTTQQTGINGGLNIANFISSIIGAFLTDRMGRRPLWMLSYISMIVIFVPFIALSAVYQEHGKQSAGYGVIVCLFLFDIMYNVACNPLLYSYTTEIMPFHMRSKGLALKNVVGQVALIINVYVNPIAMQAITWKYYLVFLIFNVGWLFLIWMFFPETKGYTLEELSNIFDDNASTVVLVGEKVGEEENTTKELSEKSAYVSRV